MNVGEGGSARLPDFRNVSKEAEVIYQNYVDMVFRIAIQNVRNIMVAEDIMQEVFVRLLQQNWELISEEHLKAWLIRVTINLCKDHFKSAWFRKRSSLEEYEDYVLDGFQSIREKSCIIKYLAYQNSKVFLCIYTMLKGIPTLNYQPSLI